MTVSPVFNRMLSASQIEDQTIVALKAWYPTYLREVERQLGLQEFAFPTPENYSDRNSFDMEAPEPLPKIVVLAPGTVGSPSKQGDGSYSSIWRLGIGIAVGARTEQEANQFVKGYGAAARGIMLQNSGFGDLGGIDIQWVEEAYDDIPVPSPSQLVKAASIMFNVEISDVVTRGGGPATPDQTAYEQFETVEVDLEIEEVSN